MVALSIALIPVVARFCWSVLPICHRVVVRVGKAASSQKSMAFKVHCILVLYDAFPIEANLKHQHHQYMPDFLGLSHKNKAPRLFG